MLLLLEFNVIIVGFFFFLSVFKFKKNKKSSNYGNKYIKYLWQENLKVFL